MRGKRKKEDEPVEIEDCGFKCVKRPGRRETCGQKAMTEGERNSVREGWNRNRKKCCREKGEKNQ